MRKLGLAVLFLAVFLALLCVSSGAFAASSGRCGNNVTYVLDDNGVLTISGTGAMRNYSSTNMNGAYITSAPWGPSVTSVVIEDGVTSIGNFAFYCCSSLTSVTIPDSVTSIGNYAFYCCSSLTSVTIPDSVTSIGSSTFSNCSSLTSVTIPDSVTSIGEYAFCDCSSLTSATILANVTSIGYGVFANCSALMNVTIPGSVTSIGNGMFANCSALMNVTIPGSVTSIGNSTFNGCSSLTSVTIRDGVTSIGGYAFRDCSSLTSVTIPDSVTSIGDWAFGGCSSLTNVTIPDSVTSIGDWAFSDCSSLTSVTIPDSVTSIGDRAFYSCSSLTSVTIQDGVTRIGDDAFYSCSSLTSVTIPSSVTSIGNWAFSGCSKLKHIAILGDTVSFGTYIFSSRSTIYCYEYTDVDRWAAQQGYNAVYLDEINLDDIRTVTLETDFRMTCGESRTVSINIFPDDQPDITWTSSNPAIISVDNGMVTSLSNGTATVTSTVGNVSDSVNIEVFTPATGFTLSQSEVWLIAKTSLQLSVIAYEPADASAEIAWSSSDTSLATVSGKGQVTTYKPGDVTITATTEQGVSRECLLHLCYPVTAIAFAEEMVSISVGETAQLTANVTMRTQSCVNHLVTFSSSDEAVATVSGTGAVTAHALGTATITATSASGVSAECAVTVRALNILTLPANTETIESEAFASLPNVDRIVIPAAVTSIADDAFSGSNITIVAPADSYAANWAAEHNILCIIQD